MTCLVYPSLHIFYDVLELMDIGLYPHMIRVHGRNIPVDVVEILDVANQTRVVLDVPEICPGRRRSVAIGVQRVGRSKFGTVEDE